ncbi:MAG: SO2930 family diheme c-type cytochrome, partial [Sphingopyxis sp.]
DAPRPVDMARILADDAPARLSTFGFFDGSADRPSAQLIPYTLFTPLFSDYAEKRRYIALPAGQAMVVRGTGLVDFPVGTALIKNFGYHQADAPGGYRTLETRLLLRRAGGWVALPYIWRADGSDADLRIAGARMDVQFADAAGRTRRISYAVPNRNQCKNCHELAGGVTPIGPKWRNLRLAQPAYRAAIRSWALRGVPVSAGAASAGAVGGGVGRGAAMLPIWDDPASGPLANRARAYLDVNCAHCHNPAGSASNSGLFLEYERPAGLATGIGKRPVAAGRGAGGREYAIVPGHAEQSIMTYRMGSTDPGVAMPELGRSTVHDEGLALISEWIAAMRDDDTSPD